MRAYEITFARSARKELERLETPVASRILERIFQLGSNPRPSGCRKLEGASNLWRLRVGDYRVIYSIMDSEFVVDICLVRHRSDAYR